MLQIPKTCAVDNPPDIVSQKGTLGNQTYFPACETMFVEHAQQML